jgi:hypothetical protein
MSTGTKDLGTDADKSQWRNLAGYPWLPCPICKGVEGCSDTRKERAIAYGHNIVQPTGGKQ